MSQREDIYTASGTRTKRARNDNTEALATLVRALAVQQAHRDHEEQYAETRRDLHPIFIGPAE